MLKEQDTQEITMKHKHLNPAAEMAVDILLEYLETDQEECPFSDDPPENWQLGLARHISYELLTAANAPIKDITTLWTST